MVSSILLLLLLLIALTVQQNTQLKNNEIVVCYSQTMHEMVLLNVHRPGH